jgi:hypothetical protein
MHLATVRDATRNSERCNTQQPEMQTRISKRRNTQQPEMQRPTAGDATPNSQRCNAQQPEMQRPTARDATRTCQRCISHHTVRRSVGYTARPGFLHVLHRIAACCNRHGSASLASAALRCRCAVHRHCRNGRCLLQLCDARTFALLALSKLSLRSCCAKPGDRNLTPTRHVASVHRIRPCGLRWV